MGTGDSVAQQQQQETSSKVVVGVNHDIRCANNSMNNKKDPEAINHFNRVNILNLRIGSALARPSPRYKSRGCVARPGEQSY